MIITLRGANFKDSNIGTLSTWRISTVLGDGATYNGVTSVDRDPVTGLNATVTIAEGYEVNTDNIVVTMGGVGQVFTHVGNVITISIAQVTGNVQIKVPTVKIGGSEPDVGGGGNEEPDTPDVGGGDNGGNENISSVDITDRFVFTILGPILASTGEQNTSNKSSYGSDYVDISGFKTLEMTRLTTTNAAADNGLAFYDANKTYISGLTQNNGSPSMSCMVNTIEVPDGAVYVRTTWCAPTSGTNASTGPWATNGTANTPFSCIGHTGTSTGGGTVVSKCTVSTTIGSCATYSGVTSVNKGDAFTGTVTIAEGYELTGTPTVTMGGNAVNSGVTTSGNTITINIPTVSGNIVITVNTKAVYTGDGTDITDRFIFTTLGPIISTDGTQNTSNKSSYGSDYADISGFSSIELTQLSTSSTTSVNGLAFYDADKKYISGQAQILGDTTTSYGVRTIDVPENAVYVRTTWFKPTSGVNECTGAWKTNATMADVEFSCIGHA